MHPNFHQFLYDFFIKGHDLDRIAATYESAWYEVAEVLDTEPARRHMQTAIRVERLRDVAQNLASRRSAIRTLEGVIQDRSQTAAGHEGRRRAADAILRGTTPRSRSTSPARAPARSNSTRPPVCPAPLRTSEPQKPSAPTAPTPARELTSASSASTPASRRATPHAPPIPARETQHSARRQDNSS